MNYRILPPDDLIETTVNLPLSKSLSNRALIIAALTPGAASPSPVADCDDTAALISGLEAADGTTVDVGAAGTAMRFLTAYFAASPGKSVTIDGTERMRRRPIGPLVDALRAAGAEISYLGEEGFPPLAINGRRLEGGELDIDSTMSSQFISALMMIAPAMQRGLRLNLKGDTVSRPYIGMTAGLMTQAGIEIERSDSMISIAPGSYRPVNGPIEADWSAASYWFEIAAISSGFVNLRGLNRHSLQGDASVAELMKVTGLTSEWTDDGELELLPTPDPQSRLITDLGGCPDLTQTLAVTCCMLSIPFRFSGLSTLRIKETDRLEALKEELIKFGFPLTVEDDTLMWDGRRYPIYEPPVVNTYDDHRMAMAFAPAAIFVEGLQINDIEVVSKSYPGFWDDLRGAGFTLQEVGE